MSVSPGRFISRREISLQRCCARKNRAAHLSCLNNFCFRTFRFVILASFALLASCGNGGGGGSGSPPPSADPGVWVTIESPTSGDSYTTANTDVFLDGTASIYCKYGCSNPPDSSTASKIGTRVSWTNLTTGDSGDAYQFVYVCYFFEYYYCDHTWNASVPLAPGTNDIRVSSNSGLGWGYDNLLVYRADSVKPIVDRVTSGGIAAYSATVSVDVQTGNLPTAVSAEFSLDSGFTNVVLRLSESLVSTPYRQTAKIIPSSLQPGTEYFVRATASNARGVSNNLTTSFTTSSSFSPVVYTNSSPEFSLIDATLKSSINPNGLATEAWFELSTDPGLVGATETIHESVGSGKIALTYSRFIDGLTPGTEYYYRAHASNSAGTKVGYTWHFVASSPPTVTTLKVTGFNDQTAILRADVTTNYSSTYVWFELGTDPTLATFSRTTSELASDGLYQKSIYTLVPLQTYYYRAAVARSGSPDITRGDILSFTTLAP
jgi:hypothetical protein